MRKVNNSVNYRFNVYQIDTSEGPQWCVEYPDISAVVGGGNTPEEAIADAKENLNAYIEYLQEEGIELPIPSKYESEYSGKVTLRMSYSLHKKISELAELEGVSVNYYINQALIEKTQNDINEESLIHILSEKTSKIKNKILKSLQISDGYEINTLGSGTINKQEYYISNKGTQYLA